MIFGNLYFQVHFIVAACENMISGTGMRPGDIVTASNGKTIEVYLLCSAQEKIKKKFEGFKINWWEALFIWLNC